MEETQLRFSLGIYRFEKDGKIKFMIHSENTDVPDEIMITLVHNWLKKMEDIYYGGFSSKYLL